MSSHSDTDSTYLICMACKERGEEEEEEERKRWKELWDKGEKKNDSGVLREPADSEFFLEVSIVQRTFEMAHLTALYSTLPADATICILRIR